MRRQLVLVALATTSMVALAFVIPFAGLVRTVAADRALAGADRAAQALVPVLGVTDDPALIGSAVELAAAGVPGTLSVFLADGTVVGAAADADEHVAAAMTGQAVRAEVDGGRVLASPVVLGDGSVAVVRIALPAEALRRGVLAAWGVLGGLGVALVIGAVAVADRLGRSTVRSVAELGRVATRLGEGDLDASGAPTSPPEVAEVGRALETLAGRIEELLAAERELVADLSHRLRTPLAALRLDVERLADPSGAQRLAGHVDALSAEVDRLIEEARQPAHALPARTDLAAVVRDRQRFWAALAEHQARRCRFEVADGPLRVPLPRSEVEAVVDALVGNVLAHTPEGVAFEVRAELVAGGAARLVVEDEGPGLSSPALAARGASAGGSSGLGLDIVRRAAQRSAGDLALGSGAAGGLRVAVTFGAG